MDNRFINGLKKFFFEDKKKSIIFVIGIIGVLLIMLSEIGNTGNKIEDNNNYENVENTNYVDTLEKKTTNIISNINGVGSCKVMITVEETNENVYAQNIDENNQHGYYSQNNEYVLYKDNNGETPMLIKENYPKISGVAVVCDGADKIEVKKQIIEVITSLFDISSSHISVSKIKQ